MPISLRMAHGKEEAVKRAAKKAGKTKTAFIIEAVDEKLGLTGNREQLVRKTAGWLTSEEASDLKAALRTFDEIREEDWA